MPLQFLRPMGLPRSTTLRYFLGVARLSTNSTSATSATSASSSSTSTSTSTPPQITSAEAPNQPYHVSRTHSKNLPVYGRAKAGGNLKQTIIRKIEGDIMKLKEQLEGALFNKEVRVNHLTKQIIIKGSCQLEVRQFLEERHF
ncbi:6e5cbd31-0af8-4f5e-abb5-507f3fc95a05 [Sclerotinia trifoliorum]|uniref:Large ribosomal subunit protein mL49 n=1 Tax=Sclerotinia trifoliorum TaxID=28548 RepID=A0A8H2W6W0_9HELO|nr:6e5cbd31-0af8-4f5e-abb5-507f3fc95a05 [Sclerotinia trifoliorum]